MQKVLGAPRFESSHVLAQHSNQQQTAAVVMVPLLALQIDQICEVTFFHYHFSFFFK
jgi:hypothetical protein